MKKVLLFGVIIILGAILGGIIYLKTALPNIPVKEVQVEATEAHLQRGEYLANHVMLCVDCHGTRDWTKFSGPMVENTNGMGGELFDQSLGFPGQYVSANITPHNLSDWTDGEIYRAITSGVKKNGEAIFPVMPYMNYGQLDDEDIYAVIAYIRSLQPLEYDAPSAQHDFPMNLIINTIPKAGNPTQRPSPEDQIAYGKYMVTAGACIDCHTPFVDGALVMEEAFSGGREFPLPTGGTVYSANLTPHKGTGLGNWTEEQFITRFKAYDLSHYTPNEVKPGEFQTWMPWTMYSGMDTVDLKAIFAYLQALEPIEKEVVKFVPDTDTEKAAL